MLSFHGAVSLIQGETDEPVSFDRSVPGPASFAKHSLANRHTAGDTEATHRSAVRRFSGKVGESYAPTSARASAARAVER